MIKTLLDIYVSKDRLDYSLADLSKNYKQDSQIVFSIVIFNTKICSIMRS